MLINKKVAPSLVISLKSKPCSVWIELRVVISAFEPSTQL